MRLILNLGCGSKTSAHPDVVNVDWSIVLYIRKNPLLRAIAPLLLNGARLSRLKSLPSNIVVHDLRKGIPFESGSVDAVYHSHVLEHFDRDAAPRFLAEVTRVLKPGGIHRIVVPDLETQCRDYLKSLEACAIDPSRAGQHDERVAALLEQSVRREASGTSRQKPLRRRVENLLLGDARKRGETHQWMYDRVNLASLLSRLGYRGVRVRSYRQSGIPDWERIGLDLDAQAAEYKPGSLYVEATR
jgi:SAM-dependent methyltransferase